MFFAIQADFHASPEFVLPCKTLITHPKQPLVLDRVPKTLFSGLGSAVGLRQVEQGFSSIFAKFLAHVFK